MLRLVAGTYFVLTSLYCLLAYLPYTFFFLINAPPYAWMPWFGRHQAALDWVAAAAAVAATWRLREAWMRRDRSFLVGIGMLAAAGVYLSFRPYLATLQDNRASYAWSLAALLPLAAVALWKPTLWQERRHLRPDEQLGGCSADDHRTLGYSGGSLVAIVICTIYTAGMRMRLFTETRTLRPHWVDAELTLWSLLSHLVLAVAVVSAINLIFALAAKTPNSRRVRRAGVGVLVLASLWIALLRFLENALSFGGWAARAYSGALALTLTLWGFSIVLPFLDATFVESANPLLTRLSGRRRRGLVIAWIVLAAAAALAIASPYLLGGADWSGFLEDTVTLLVWIAVSVCLFRLRPSRVQYSALAVLLVLIGSATAYKTLQAGEIFWSRPLGATDDEISLALEAYGGHDSSFQLAHHIL
ncbi:MAG: hypothetical protein WBG19_01335, partial [Thermoplasmata archaeon]